MTCQPMRDFEEKDASSTTSSASTSLGPSTSSSPPGPIIPLIKLEGDYVEFERSRLNSEDGTTYPHYGNCTKYTIDTEDRCSACTSFRNGPCLLSNDHQTRTSYISSEVALQDKVYERVKSACMRSLSCEVSAAMKKNLSSSQPVTLSRLCTPRKWHPQVIHEEPINEISGTRIPPSSAVLQEPNEDGVFEQPAAEEADGCLIFGDVDNGYCFAFVFRLADAKARGFYRLFSLIVVSNDLTFLTTNHDYLKTTLGGIKTELQKMAQDVFNKEIDTGEKLTEDDIHKPEYQKLVGKMPSWYRRKIAIETDRNLSVVTASEEIWVQLHRHMMWTLRSPTIACRDQVMEGKPTQDMMVLMELDESQIVELELRHPNQHLLLQVSMSQLCNLKIIANYLYNCSEPGDLDLLICHVVTGGQVVVECREKEYSRQFLLAISNLLPIGCIKLATYKEHYMPEYSHQFNLIGGPHNMDVPLDVPDVMVIRVLPRDLQDDQTSLANCIIEVRRRPEREGTNGQLPQIVKRFHDVLVKLKIPDSVLESVLRNTREGWMLKAKICFQMKNQLPESEVFKYITGVNVEDRDVVMFWTAGLSDAYKQHVLTTISQSRAALAASSSHSSR
uniref:Folliculin n=2 Tax=Caenorhabditis tropicalis TaxID=1561998 RepID=A0A1I7TV80_9PELO